MSAESGFRVCVIDPGMYAIIVFIVFTSRGAIVISGSSRVQSSRQQQPHVDYNNNHIWMATTNNYE